MEMSIENLRNMAEENEFYHTITTSYGDGKIYRSIAIGKSQSDKMVKYYEGDKTGFDYFDNVRIDFRTIEQCLEYLK